MHGVKETSARQTAYAEHVRALLDNHNGIYTQYANRVFGLMRDARERIRAQLLTIPARDWKKFELTRIGTILDDVMTEFQRDYMFEFSNALADSAANGISSVIDPMQANLNVAGLVGTPDLFLPVSVDPVARRLMANTQTLITSVSAEAAQRIQDEIIIGMLSGEPQHIAVDKIMKNIITDLRLEKQVAARGVPKWLSARSWTIFRTETLRMHSISNNEQMAQSRTLIPEAQKMWIHGAMFGAGQKPRPGHVALDGTVVPFNDPFEDPLTGDLLMYPRDPEAPASSVINCGCAHVLHMPSEKFLRDRTMVTV